MHPDNSFYGHAGVLRTHAGIPDNVPLGVQLQHGWQLGTGLNAKERLVPWLPKLVWNARNAGRCALEGINRVTPIGAPFVYLAGRRRTSANASGTICFPFHPWERSEVRANHNDLAARIRDRESGDVTVCLYHLDFDVPEVRRSYEDRGFRVVTNGPRDGNPDFLHRLLHELAAHRRVISNRVTTAVFCGAYLRMEAEVYGPMFEVDRPDDPGEIFGTDPALHKLAHGGHPSDAAKSLADDELGASFVRSGEDLRDLLCLEIASSRIQRARFRVSHHVRRAWSNRPFHA